VLQQRVARLLFWLLQLDADEVVGGAEVDALDGRRYEEHAVSNLPSPAARTRNPREGRNKRGTGVGEGNEFSEWKGKGERKE